MAKLLTEPDSPCRTDGGQFELEGWVSTAPFEDLLEMTVDKAEKGEALLHMPFLVKFAQGGGLLHGGAVTALADTSVAMAIKSLLPEGTVFATTELTTRFLAPVREGAVTARAVVRGPEGRTFRGEAVVTDEEGREIAHFSSVFRVARNQGFEE